MFGLNVDSDELSFMVSQSVCSLSQIGSSTMIFVEFNSASLNIECFWRLRDSDRLIITSNDKKHPDYDWSKDPVEEIKLILAGKQIRSCYLAKETEDLFIQFENDIWLDVLRDSTMYESWQIDAGEQGYYIGG
ncbi:hypothetical protein JOC85_004398 [Bacillus mesophilus]|uniref:Uncharacterized protein n=1 Tax=Bacillus mesophilus TaxID=1808955 RepID=A0A6M0QDB1_9BACI|nr:hypothetical protein [Bacillus mesophilus]MBM7663520.1 hypothetical protein [Bacillus mesophilus]NEY74197.1 hypothetical protein [Bacillus mesophilus]